MYKVLSKQGIDSSILPSPPTPTRPRHKATSALHHTSLSKKKKTTRKGKKRDGGMDGFLLPGAKSHYAPDLMILPLHQGIETGVWGVGREGE